MKLGFIGTGIIAVSVATGFCESGIEDLRIIVSPRNRERAAALREKYPDIITIASDNQEVIDRSDWVFLAVLPQAAEDVLRELTFPQEKNFISLVPTLSLKTAEELIGKREVLADVVPLTFAANRIGPVVLYPPMPQVSRLLSHIGAVVPVDTPRQMSILRSVTGLMSPYYMLLSQMTDWCCANGLDELSARKYVTAFTSALSEKASAWEGPLENLAREMTPGGLNWQALNHLEENDAFQPWTEILDPILQRVKKDW